MAVFVICSVAAHRKNLEDAERYGNLFIVTDRFTFIDEVDQGGHLPKEVRFKIDSAVSRFIPGVDYVLPIGDLSHVSYFIFRLGFRAAREGWDVFPQALRYDRHLRAYYPIQIGETDVGIDS